MIPEAPFLFAIAGLSASLAGLAGLVAGLRRGTDLRPIDAFRLREIVEFAFANIVFAVGIVPLLLLLPAGLGGATGAIRIAALLVLAYAVASTVILLRRSTREGIAWTRGWSYAAGGLNFVILAAAITVLATGSMAWYEATLVALLARPMLAFLLVLASFEAEPPPERPPTEP